MLVQVAPGQSRPLLITSTRGATVSGVILCEPDDYQTPAFRGALDRQPGAGRIEGRPSFSCPVGWGKMLSEGDAVGQWRKRETR